MKVSSDVMELVQLLNEEGFGVIAGQLLTELSLGREIESSDPQYGSGGLGEPEDMELREPIPETEQLGVALEFLESQLVGPVRHLAEAETIAGRLAAPPEAAVRAGGEKMAVDAVKIAEPVRIVFRPLPDRFGEVLKRTEAPGSTRWADALSNALWRLVDRST